MGDAADTFIDGAIITEAHIDSDIDSDNKIIPQKGQKLFKVIVEDVTTTEELWSTTIEASSNKQAMLTFRKDYVDVRQKYKKRGNCRLRVKKFNCNFLMCHRYIFVTKQRQDEIFNKRINDRTDKTLQHCMRPLS